MDFLRATWLWLLLGVVALWWLVARAGRGCGVGRREPDPQAGRPAGDQSEATHDHPHMTGDTDNGARRGQETGNASYSRRQGG